MATKKKSRPALKHPPIEEYKNIVERLQLHIKDQQLQLDGFRQLDAKAYAASPQPKGEDESILSAKARSSIALEAVSLVYGPRQDDYGPVVSCFDRCATIMNVIKDKTDTNTYTGKQVALLMIAMKLARRQYHYKRDNNVDLIGYADLLEVFEVMEPLR